MHAPVIQPCGAARSPLAVGGPRSRVVATDFAVGGQRSRVVATDFAVGGQRSRDPDVGGSVDVRNAPGAGQVLHPTNEVHRDRAHPANEVECDRAHPANERQLRAP